MRILLAIVIFVLALPVLLFVAVALGPAAWAIAGLAATIAVVGWVSRFVVRRGRGMRVVH
jgi:hypothetical protein